MTLAETDQEDARAPARAMPLQEAAREYDIHRSTLHKLIASGVLTRMRRMGDKRTWLSADELDRVLRPHAE